MKDNSYKIWVGGSCDYAHKERTGGGAYIVEHAGMILDKFTTAEINTTEFRMMLQVMIHAMQKLEETCPNATQVEFLSNVQYLQNFDRLPDNLNTQNTSSKSKINANADLIVQCIALKETLARRSSPINVTVKTVPFHKHPEQAEVHQMASDAMRELRKKTNAHDKPSA